MKQKTEKPQRFNETGIDFTESLVSSGVNRSETRSNIGTPLTQLGSPNVPAALAAMSADLTAMRREDLVQGTTADASASERSPGHCNIS